MNIYLDTNVVIDYVLHREEFYDNAKSIILLGFDDGYHLGMSAITFVTTLYIAEKHKKDVIKARQTLLALSGFVEVVDLTSYNVTDCLSLDWADYEDSTQYQSAIAFDSDTIITRNPKDFILSHIPAKTPQEFLSQESL